MDFPWRKARRESWESRRQGRHSPWIRTTPLPHMPWVNCASGSYHRVTFVLFTISSRDWRNLWGWERSGVYDINKRGLGKHCLCRTLDMASNPLLFWSVYFYYESLDVLSTFCNFDHCTDLGDMDSLFREFDEVLFKRAVADNRLGLLDASSLLWRLNTMGVEVGEERWKRVTDALATHVNNHRSPWLV